MDVMLIHCECGRWSRAAAGGRARCPGCGGSLEVPPGAGAPSPPRRRWPRLILAALLVPTAGFLARAASGDWRGVLNVAQARLEAERRTRARFDEVMATGRAAKDEGDFHAAIAAYKQAVALGTPGSTRRTQADQALKSASTSRAEARDGWLEAAARARTAHDYETAKEAIAKVAAAYEKNDPEAVAAAKTLEEVEADAKRFPLYAASLKEGDACRQARKYVQALKAYKEAAALFPDDEPAKEAIEATEKDRELLAAQLDDRAGTAEAAGDHAKAAELLSQLVDDAGGTRVEIARERLKEANRSIARAFAARGLDAVSRNDFEAAVRDFDRALAAGSKDPKVSGGKRQAERELALERCGRMLAAGSYDQALDAAVAAERLSDGDARTVAVVKDARAAVDYAEIRRVRIGGGPARALAFRRELGRLAIAAGDGRIQTWDARDGRFDAPVWERAPNGRETLAVALSEDGRWAAVATRDSIELIDLDRPETGARLVAAPAPVSALAVGPGDPPRLAAGARNGSAWTWPSTTPEAKPVTLASSSTRPVTRVRLSRGGDVAVGRDSGPVELYRPKGSDHAQLTSPSRNAAVNQRAVTSLTFAPDGTILMDGRAAGSVASWSLFFNKVQIDKPMDREVADMAFSDDGGLFAVASEDGKILIGFNDKAAGVPSFHPTTIPELHRDAVLALAFQDDAVLATGGADGTVKLWSLKRGPLAKAVGK